MNRQRTVSSRSLCTFTTQRDVIQHHGQAGSRKNSASKWVGVMGSLMTSVYLEAPPHEPFAIARA